MKKSAVLALVIVMIPCTIFAKGVRPIHIYLNGQNITENQKVHTVMKEDRTFVPLRVIAEELGCKVDWNQEKKEVKVSQGEDLLLMRVGSKEYSKNNAKMKMDVEPFIEEDKTYLPVRFVGESLGIPVEWDQENRMVVLGDYYEELPFNKEVPTYVSGLDISFILPEEYKENIIYEEGQGQYSFLDKANLQTKWGGFLGNFLVKKDPLAVDVESILLGKGRDGYLIFAFPGDVNYDHGDKALSQSYKDSQEKVRQVLKTVKVENLSHIEDRILANEKEDKKELALIKEILKVHDREGFLQGVEIYKSSMENSEVYSITKLKSPEEVSILATFSFFKGDLKSFVLKNYSESYSLAKLTRQEAQVMAQKFLKGSLGRDIEIEYDSKAYPSISDPGSVEAFSNQKEKVKVAVDLESGRVVRANLGE